MENGGPGSDELCLIDQMPPEQKCVQHKEVGHVGSWLRKKNGPRENKASAGALRGALLRLPDYTLAARGILE